MHLILKAFAAVEASRRMSEDRQSGALELLLVSPLPVRSIIAGQQNALMRHFKGAMRLLALVNLTMVLTVLIFHERLSMSGKEQAIFAEMFLGGIVAMVLDFRALGWLGMWLGLRAKRHHRAVVGNLLRIMGLPWLAIFLLFFLQPNVTDKTIGWIIGCWFALGALIDCLFLGVLRQKLAHELRVIVSS